jgi:RHS repeat-associated protein
LFTGRELDGDSRLQYNRARYYLSEVGGWNREDPINHRESRRSKFAHISEFLWLDSEATKSFLGLYLYAGGNPLIYSDPEGKKYIFVAISILL